MKNGAYISKKEYEAAVVEIQSLSLRDKPDSHLAVTKISKWWRTLRNSRKAVFFNPKGNHSDAFHFFLNKYKNIPKRFTYFQDQVLLEDIQKGAWDSKRFHNNNFHSSLMNLFAAGKIDWQQKATLSSVMETTRVYGRFIPYCILTPEGEFTAEASLYLLPFLKKQLTVKEKEAFSEEELEAFRKSILALPLSERYFFIFPDQKLDEKGSFPSRHSLLRNELVGRVFEMGLRIIKPTNRVYGPTNKENTIRYNRAVIENKGYEFSNTVTTENHPNNLKYEGILKLSYGAEDALGLLDFGPQDWWTVVPRLGKQKIDDIDELSYKKIRPTVTPESLHLGLEKDTEFLHGDMHEFPEREVHDGYHRVATAVIGMSVHDAVERIILLARETFGYKWSKDIWLLRDFDLGLSFRGEGVYFSQDKKVNITLRFAQALKATYAANQLENCEEKIQKMLRSCLIMTDEHKHPRQIALVFVIDLVRNPHIWKELNILNDAKYYVSSPYEKLIQIAQFLNQNGFFNDNMKENVIKFSQFIEGENFVPPAIHGLSLPFGIWDPNHPSVLLAVEKLKTLSQEEVDGFEPGKENGRVFLGFRKPAHLQAQSEHAVTAATASEKCSVGIKAKYSVL